MKKRTRRLLRAVVLPALLLVAASSSTGCSQLCLAQTADGAAGGLCIPPISS